MILPWATRRFAQDYTLGVYIGTGIAVLLYTVETYFLRHEMVRQNAITIQPLVVSSVEFKNLGAAGSGGSWSRGTLAMA